MVSNEQRNFSGCFCPTLIPEPLPIENHAFDLLHFFINIVRQTFCSLMFPFLRYALLIVLVQIRD
jgi:hypothetical protein